MRHIGTQPLETDRLILRRLSMDDAQTMYANWASDPEVTRYLRWEPHRNWTQTAEILYEWEKQYVREDFYQWGLVEKSTGALFGSIGVILAEPDTGWQRPPMQTATQRWEPGYCMGKAWWGRGYMTEALRAVCGYWFDGTDGEFLLCSHAVQNPASGRVMQKAGFVYDHETVYHKFDGTAVPCRVYYLTREMWEQAGRS